MMGILWMAIRCLFPHAVQIVMLESLRTVHGVLEIGFGGPDGVVVRVPVHDDIAIVLVHHTVFTGRAAHGLAD